LPDLLPDIIYRLGAFGVGGPTFAFDLQVAPGLPHTTAVSRGYLVSYSAGAGMAIYDDATERPIASDDNGDVYDSLQWGSDTTIYANDNETSFFPLFILNVSSTGVVQSKEYLNEFSNFYVDIHYDSGTGLIYTDDGYVIDPSNGQHVGDFQASGLMIPDSAVKSAFFSGRRHLKPALQVLQLNRLTKQHSPPRQRLLYPMFREPLCISFCGEQTDSHLATTLAMFTSSTIPLWLPTVHK
jgi:hypothetical protein